MSKLIEEIKVLSKQLPKEFPKETLKEPSTQTSKESLKQPSTQTSKESLKQPSTLTSKESPKESLKEASEKASEQGEANYIFKKIPYLLIGLFLLFLLFVYSEIQTSLNQKMAQIKKEIELCKITFNQNKCDNPVPLTEIQCMEWKLCTEQNPYEVAKSEHSYGLMLVKLLNDAIDSLSFKVLGIIILLIVLLIIHIEKIIK
jgi:Di-sulfide bridge nucleocytoplasmic transport domain